MDKVYKVFQYSKIEKMYTLKEQKIIEQCSTPELIQQYINSLNYDWEYKEKYIARSFRRTIQDEKALCICGALTGAHLLENLGHNPKILVISGEKFGHVAAVYKENSQYGTVGFSRYQETRNKPPQFLTIEDLAREYKKELEKYTYTPTKYGLIDLLNLDMDWRFSPQNLSNFRIGPKVMKQSNRPFREYIIL